MAMIDMTISLSTLLVNYKLFHWSYSMVMINMTISLSTLLVNHKLFHWYYSMVMINMQFCYLLCWLVISCFIGVILWL